MSQDERITELENQVKDLSDFIRSLNSTSTIPYNIETSFKARIGLKASSHVIAGKSVNESGSGSYSVAKIYDKMKETVIDGEVCYVGVYTS